MYQRIFCLPSFIVIGVQKGSTGELRKWLSQHPALLAHRGERQVEQEVDACLAGLEAASLIDGVDSVLDVTVEHVPNAYVLQDPNYPVSRTTLLDYLKSQNILSTGRYGNWEYSAMEDALIHGRKAAEWLAKT